MIEVVQFSIEATVREKIEKTVDPITELFLGAMRLITGVNETEEGVLKIDFVPSTPYSPVVYSIALAIREVVLAQKEVKKVMVFCHNHVLLERINADVNAR